MKKLIIAVTPAAGLGVNASALYFDGGLTGTTGPDYSGYKLNLRIGEGDFALEPSLTTYKYDTAALANKTYRTYGARGAWEKEKYTAGGDIYKFFRGSREDFAFLAGMLYKDRNPLTTSSFNNDW